MNNFKLFNREIFSLPKTISKGYLPDYVNGVFEDFLKEIKLFEGNLSKEIESNYASIEKLCESIVKSLKAYYLGDTIKAYYELDKGIKVIEPFLKTQGKGVASKRLLSLYRCRVGDNKVYSRKEMFHVPFELRDRVASQRFSIPGLPCLYLGNSVYVCWEELRRPDINKLQVSRLEVPYRKLVMLDLALTPSHLYYIYKSLVGNERVEEMISEFIIKWPLIFASTLKVTNQTASFKAEYIIPQLLLQWVSNNKKVDGIIYFSSRTGTDYSKYNGCNLNYVIPVKTVSKGGFCRKLRNDFAITNSVSWQLISLSNPNHNLEKKHTQFEKLIEKQDPLYNTPSWLELIEGASQNYYDTTFGRLEFILDNMEAQKI